MKTIKKLVAVTSAFTIIGFAGFGAQSAFAASSTINPGSLTMTTPAPTASDFDAITLNGHVQTTTATLSSFSVTDATGSGAGWNVQINADKFTNGTNALDSATLAIAAPTVSEEAGSSSAADLDKIGSTQIIGTSGVPIISAGTNEGMGTFTVDPATLTLTVNPKDAKAGTYTSTVTVSLVAGPQQ